METLKLAIGRWDGILTSFGLGEEHLSGRHGPCPMCDGKDRFRYDNIGGRGTYICGNCGAGDGMALAMGVSGQGFKQVADKIDQMIGTIEPTRHNEKQKKDPRIRIYKISREVSPANDSINPVKLYLASRGIKIIPPSIRFHPSLPYYLDGKYAGSYPAMVCPIRNVDGMGVSLHITYLTAQGSKAPVEASRKILPPRLPMMGGAIRLSPLARVLGITEGVETALAVMQQYNIPCWATANSGMMEKFEVPEGVETIRVFGDNDISYTGQKAAYTLAARVVGQGLAADVTFPSEQGSDFADNMAARV